MTKKTEEERKKVVERISKHIHPHDDEPDPTAHMGNYNFPQMLFAFCLGVATMFVAAFIVHINDPFSRMEKAILFLAVFMALMLIGPGKYSLDKS